MRRILIASLITLAACDQQGTRPDSSNGNNPYKLPDTGRATLTVFPLDTTTVVAITPLGQVSPPGHTLPTDHIYVMFVDPWGGNQQNADCRQRPVRAAAPGYVSFVYQTESAGDTKVDIQVTATFHYYYDHVLLKPGVVLGTHVNAGDTIATTTGRCPSMDLGVWDSGYTPSGFVNAARYAGQSLHVLPPLAAFSEPLRSWLYTRVRLFPGVPVDKDGRTDFGVKGSLAGDWFHSSIATASAETVQGPDGWPRQLSFFLDYFNRAPHLSVGGMIGSVLVTPVPFDPSTIHVSDGVQGFATQAYNGNLIPGWVLVQLTADDRLKIELFKGATSRPAAFTAAAQEYVR